MSKGDCFVLHLFGNIKVLNIHVSSTLGTGSSTIATQEYCASIVLIQEDVDLTSLCLEVVVGPYHLREDVVDPNQFAFGGASGHKLLFG